MDIKTIPATQWTEKDAEVLANLRNNINPDGPLGKFLAAAAALIDQGEDITLITTPATVEVEEFVSPCGCGGCEKWADCAYCGTCNADGHWDLDVPVQSVDDLLPFGDWLLGQDEDE